MKSEGEITRQYERAFQANIETGDMVSVSLDPKDRSELTQSQVGIRKIIFILGLENGRKWPSVEAKENYPLLTAIKDAIPN